MPEQPQPFDVRKLIEQGAAKSTLQDLARKGIHKVKVLDEQAITKMIQDAVQQVVGSKANLLSEAERQKLVAQSRTELDKLVKEFHQAKDKAELLAQDKESLATDVENLQKQMKLQRQLSEQAARQAVEEAKEIAKGEVEVLQKKLELAKQEIEMTRRSASSEKESELNQRLMAEMQKNSDLSQKLAKVLEDGRTRDDEIAKKMEALFNKSIEGLSRKLSDLKFKAGAGVAADFGGGEESFRQSAEVISQMLGKELESNVKAMEPTEGKVAGKLGSALDRLKAMRGGPPAKKADEKKADDKDKKEDKK